MSRDVESRTVAAPTPTAPPALRGRHAVVVVAVTGVCALVAALARVPAIGWSLRPDESGYTIVAREWDPEPGSPFGRHWVDRPPLLIGIFRLADSLGGPYALRWVGVVGCALFVVLVAAVAVEVARAGPTTPGTTARAAVITTVGATALVSNASIDLVAVKGEVLSLPVLAAAAWLVLRGVRTRSAVPTLVAGLLASSAVGLKQNLVGGVVLALVLLATHLVRGTLGRREVVRLTGAFVAGAALPVLAALGWALATGVRPSAIWDAVFGFRADALDLILVGPIAAPLRRATGLVGVLVTSFAALLLLWLLLSLRRLARERPAVTVATVAVLAVDVAALVLGGSFWRPYLFALAPGVVLALALLSSGGGDRWPPPRSQVVTVVLVAGMVAGSVVAGVRWAGSWTGADRQSTAELLGRAVGAASQPGDTLTVYGGRADVQLGSGLPSPYTYLWSLPARTRDPASRELAALLRSPEAPTWLLVWVPFDAWRDGTADVLGPVVAERYERVATACGGKPLYRLRSEDRPRPAVRCADIREARATASR